MAPHLAADMMAGLHRRLSVRAKSTQRPVQSQVMPSRQLQACSRQRGCKAVLQKARSSLACNSR